MTQNYGDLPGEQSVVEDATSVEGGDVELRRVPEKLPDEVVGKMNAIEAIAMQQKVEVCTVDELGDAVR